ncbi:beta-lactamase/transpeptidase-like protein [Cylindrobasidium torrendii FP15055 ss-10]|uniref:Beta-lactamase/transpeptidase-like protein n=1 Tax=Cylindrobasidium torrendii FP15055 ss-10 TaxID=1314674 RepID=A0A0D7B5H6_9AGAR|nr:beta-lactamase/transpeptidase-like protein [Cylindrobasidium torrendii FP15055 ss-10]
MKKHLGSRSSDVQGLTLSYARLISLLLLAILTGYHLSASKPREFLLSVESRKPGCRPRLPGTPFELPGTLESQDVQRALSQVDEHIRDVFATDDGIDGLAVAIVTSSGVLWEKYMGPLKANETDLAKRGHVDKHSIFRIASGSKLFTTLETLILREKGALSLDDPITKFFSHFSYKPGGWIPGHDERNFQREPITLRQLASHMSGLGREYPRGDMPHWPYSSEGAGPPPINGAPFPTIEETLEGLAAYPLVQCTSIQPVYSNAGIALLGQAAVVVNMRYEEARNIVGGPSTWRELVKRDVFQPLDLNGSFFTVNEHNERHVAVAKEDSEEVDLDFLDTMSSSGGQMSSLADYIKLMQTILDPTRPESLLPPRVVREWLQPMHGFLDDETEVGLIWEIQKMKDSYGRPLRLFEKHGTLGASRSVFSVNKDTGYGVVWMNTGASSVAGEAVHDVFEIMQPALDEILTKHSRTRYAGIWKGIGGDGRVKTADSEIVVSVDGGTLWVDKFVLNGADVLEVTQAGVSVPLWSTGREDEFRTMFGASRGCMSAWAGIDEGFSRGFPVDLLYFLNGSKEVEMHIPSAGVVLVRGEQ